MVAMRVLVDVIDDVSVVLLMPQEVPAGRELVLWLSHLGGSVEKERPTMTRIVEAGYPVVGFDLPGHGQRATTADPHAFAAEVLASYRLRMWPLLGRSTLESMKVLSWAQQQLNSPTRPVAAGGVSMGGDVAVALAGIDDRVRRVAVVGSTPNWERPGMRNIGDPDQLLDQGQADRYARWFADHLDPASHLERYRRQLSIVFELGGADHHIPAANAMDFRRALVDLEPEAEDRIRISVRDGLDHFGVTTNEDALQAAIDELTLQS